MKLTAEQLHERGPPLTNQERNSFDSAGRDLTIAGALTMAATAADALLLDHSMTRSEWLTHGVGEVAGLFIIGLGQMFHCAARSKNASFTGTRENILKSTKNLGCFAALALGTAAAHGYIESNRDYNDKLAHSAAAKNLPKMDCDKKLYKDAPTTPRHFREGRDVFVFQGHLVECKTAPPAGFQPLATPISGVRFGG